MLIIISREYFKLTQGINMNFGKIATAIGGGLVDAGRFAGKQVDDMMGTGAGQAMKQSQFGQGMGQVADGMGQAGRGIADAARAPINQGIEDIKRAMFIRKAKQYVGGVEGESDISILRKVSGMKQIDRESILRDVELDFQKYMGNAKTGGLVGGGAMGGAMYAE